MKQILTNLINTVSASNTCNKEALKDYIADHASSAEILYKKDYPVAVVNENRQKDNSKQNVRNVDIVALSKDVEKLDFVAKRPQDFWKRLTSVEHILAMVSLQSVVGDKCSDEYIEKSLNESAKHQWSVETELRDAMRANKENRELGAKPFVIILCTDNTVCTEETDHLLLLLKHYFHNNVTTFISEDKKIKYYLAYNEHMSDIGMRYFYRFYNKK